MSLVTDKIFLSVVLILIGFGVVMVYSTSGVQAETQGNGHYFLMRHLLSILLGFTAMTIASSKRRSPVPAVRFRCSAFLPLRPQSATKATRAPTTPSLASVRRPRNGNSRSNSAHSAIPSRPSARFGSFATHFRERSSRLASEIPYLDF